MKTKKSQNIQIGFLLLPGILIFGFFTRDCEKKSVNKILL